MQIDAKLLDELDPDGHPILHFYDWAAPSLTYGIFTKPSQYLDLERAKFHRVELAKRPTGGGIVFHIWDFAFSFLMPRNHPACSLNTLENYQFVNQAVLETVKEVLFLEDAPILTEENFASKSAECQKFCMAKPTQFDVVLDQKKIAGAAQRRKKQGYLHQGTISLAKPHIRLLQDLLLSEAVFEAMMAHSFTPLGSIFDPKKFQETKTVLKQVLGQKLMEKLALYE